MEEKQYTNFFYWFVRLNSTDWIRTSIFLGIPRNCFKDFYFYFEISNYYFFLFKALCSMRKERVHISVKRLGTGLLPQWSVKTFFCLDTLLTSAGDRSPEHTEIQTSDTSKEFNYELNIHWVLILNVKAFQGEIFHFTYTSAKLKYVQWFFPVVSKLHWCNWQKVQLHTSKKVHLRTVWPLHTTSSYK